MTEICFDPDKLRTDLQYRAEADTLTQGRFQSESRSLGIQTPSGPPGFLAKRSRSVDAQSPVIKGVKLTPLRG